MIQKSETECSYCDNNTILSGDGLCVYTFFPWLPYCEIRKGAFECFQCSSNYYLDESTGVCKKAFESITGCVGFNSSGRCMACETSMRLQDDYCIPVTTPVENCLVHAGEGLCLSCKEGFSLAPSGARCDPVSSLLLVDNCKFQSGVKICGLCQQGFYGSSSPSCTPLPPSHVPHCLYHTSQFICYECEPGFYLLDTQCIPGEIPRCVVYYSASRCQTCESGYAPDSSGGCSAVAGVPGCLEQKSETECALCQVGYYLEQGSCIANPTPVPNCSLHTTADFCFECVGNFAPTAEGTCAPVTPIGGCTAYQKGATCVRCQHPKTLVAGRCEDNCVEADITASKCIKCKKGFTLSPQGDCSPLQTTDGCLTPQTGQTCSICADGYYLD